MKIFILIVVSILFTVSAQAQSQLNTPFKQKLQTLIKGKPELQKFFTHSLTNKILPRSTEESRLIASTHYNYNTNNSAYVSIDSNTFAYTGSNGGDLNSEFIDYATENEYGYHAVKYIDDTLSRQTFDANNNVDSQITQLWSGTAWQNYEEAYLAYDANNNDTLEMIYEWENPNWVPAEEIESYFTDNTEDSELIKISNGSTLENLELVTITYSGGDTAAAIQEWGDSSWENYAKITEYYNDTAELVQQGDTTAWINYERQTEFPITNGTQKYYVYEWSANKWDSAEEEINYYDSNLNDTTIIIYDFDQGEWLDDYKYSMQYNGYNQMTLQRFYDFPNTSFVPIDEDSYYYQQYTGVNQLTVNGGQWIVYPNPTSGAITVTSSKTIDDLKVTNLLGQLVYESQPKQQQFTFELNEPGLYFVTVSDDNTTSTGKVVVNK